MLWDHRSTVHGALFWGQRNLLRHSEAVEVRLHNGNIMFGVDAGVIFNEKSLSHNSPYFRFPSPSWRPLFRLLIDRHNRGKVHKSCARLVKALFNQVLGVVGTKGANLSNFIERLPGYEG